uniref:Uncharacterized protein n=1 Tax=Oryza barthii TaxID=65489 RepID=A0A0D3FE17_9ORYZ
MDPCRVCIVLIWACYGRATLYWLIAALLPALDGVAVSHLCRDENKVVHGFAKLGQKARRRRVWHVVPPNEVLVFLQRDADRG